MAKKNKSGNASKKFTPKATQGVTTSLANQDTQIVSYNEPGSKIAGQVTDANGNNPLIRLPEEVKLMIWTLAITINDPVNPQQLRERSNKFIWSNAQIEKQTGAKVVNNVATLTAVELSRVCKTMYEEIANTHLFYQVNRFDFTSPPGWRHSHNPATCPINYLVALTTERIKAIQNITCDWSDMPKEASKLFTVLATCAGLQQLTLILHSNILYLFDSTKTFLGTHKIPGFKEALVAAEGLQTLQLNICTTCCEIADLDKYQPAVTNLELALQGQKKEPRGKTKYSMSFLLMAQQDATLDMHGEGRLGEDAKPGVVASRTRNGLRKLETISDDGTLPKTVISKYDADGDLTWHVNEVLSSRRSEPEGFPPSVEFQANCTPLTGIKHWERSDLPAEVTWEDVMVLSSLHSRVAVREFYTKNPSAYGKQETVEAWNRRDRESGMTNFALKDYRYYTSRIARIAETEKRKAELAKQAAAKMAKKATKSKKGMKAKETVKH